MAYVGATPPIAPKNSPFVNFTTSFDKNSPNSGNKTHISFDQRNGSWLAKELTLVPETSSCSYICSSSQISGSDTFCTTANYSAPSGAPIYNWVITEGEDLATLTGNGTSSITLTSTNNDNGFVTIQLTYGDNNARCGDRTLTKRIHIGAPSLESFTCDYLGEDFCSGIAYASNSTTYTIDLNNEITVNFNTVVPALTAFTDWEWLPLNNLIQLHGNYKNKRIVSISNYGQTGVKVRTRNSCGWSNWVELPFEIIQIPDTYLRGNETTVYIISPNPSSDVVNIDLRDENNNPSQGGTVTGELFDLNGQSKSIVSIVNNRATFSVTELNRGIYVLKIYINDQIETHQIAVE